LIVLINMSITSFFLFFNIYNLLLSGKEGHRGGLSL
jgi:hypothetical protein